MSKAVHWWWSANVLRPYCGLREGLTLTGDKDAVTCGRCRRDMVLHGHLPLQEGT